MAIDLTKLSPKELETLISDASARMQEAHAVQVRSVKEKIESLLSSSGLSLDDIFPSRAKKTAAKNAKGGSAGVPKYRDPADPSQTWSGRGRKPAWFAKALRRRGITVEHLLIGGAVEAAPKAKRAASTKKSAKRAVKRSTRKTATKKA